MTDQKTVLIVEDESQYRQILKQKLEGEGFVVETANDGIEGLKALDKDHVSLILLDLLMPNMNGINFIYSLNNSSHKSTPVIILTNLTGSSETELSQPTIKDFLVKADTPLEEVVEKVKKYS